jgi:hypothetical protein
MSFSIRWPRFSARSGPGSTPGDRASSEERGLDLAPHQTFEVARAVEALDVGEAANRALIDEYIGDGLTVRAQRELLETRFIRSLRVA